MLRKKKHSDTNSIKDKGVASGR